MISLLVVPLIALPLFLETAVHIFEQDKLAYVFDSSLSLAQATAPQVRLTIEQILSEATLLISNFDGQRFGIQAQQTFEHDPRLIDVSIYVSQPSGLHLVANQHRSLRAPSVPRVLEYSMAHGLVVESTNAQGEIRLLQPFKTSANVAVLADLVIKSDLLNERFKVENTNPIYLLSSTGRLLLPNQSVARQYVSSILQGPFLKGLELKSNGVEEIPLPDSKTALVAFADIGVAGLKVLSTTDRSVVFSASENLIRKTAIAFFFVIIATFLFSLLASRALTRKLRELTSATRRVAEGDFSIRLQNNSSDENGELSNGFNSMANEVSQLITETSEKARMQSELRTAKQVQEMLFPPLSADLEQVEIAGFYEPASECSGDWWHYYQDSEFVYFFIGDATGHGVSAALLTSAARSAVAVIQKWTHLEPGQALSLLNSSLYETSKGTMMMTFFMGRLNKMSGELIYFECQP